MIVTNIRRYMYLYLTQNRNMCKFFSAVIIMYSYMVYILNTVYISLGMSIKFLFAKRLSDRYETL